MNELDFYKEHYDISETYLGLIKYELDRKNFIKAGELAKKASDKIDALNRERKVFSLEAKKA